MYHLSEGHLPRSIPLVAQLASPNYGIYREGTSRPAVPLASHAQQACVAATVIEKNAKEHPKEHTKEHTEEHTKEHTEEHTKGLTKEHTKEHAKKQHTKSTDHNERSN